MPKSKEYEYEICKRLSGLCFVLNEAHKRPDYEKINKTPDYNRMVGAMEQLNDVSNALRMDCLCRTIDPKPDGTHSGHTFIRKKKWKSRHG